MLFSHRCEFDISIRHNKIMRPKMDVEDEFKSYTSIFYANYSYGKGLLS